MESTKEHVLTHPFSQIIYKMHLILIVARMMMENGADSDRTVQYIMRTAAYTGIPAENVSCHIAYTTIMLNIKDEERTYTRFSKCRTNNHVGEELAGNLRLACSCFLGLSHQEANADSGANGREAVADVGKGSGHFSFLFLG